MGVSITPTDIDKLIRELDLNNDGRISLTEFEKILGLA